MNTSGTHLLIDMSGCNVGFLDHIDSMEPLLNEAIAAAGALIVKMKSYRQTPNGIRILAILQESHMSVYTIPDSNQVVADIYTCGDCDPHAAVQTLTNALHPSDTEIVELERGLSADRSARILVHRPITRVAVDCRKSHLPKTLYVDRSPGRGLGLFASKTLAPGETIYENQVELASLDTHFIMQTDAGESVLSADELGCELTIAELETFPPELLALLARHYKLSKPSSIILREHITHKRQHEVLVSGFDGLMNHSCKANTTMEWLPEGLSFQDGSPVFLTRQFATRTIQPGDELFWDYREIPGYIPPSDWIQ